MTEKDQIRLVELLKDSDQDAFDSLFRLYSPRVYRFSLGYLKSKVEAEEIVQDTFLKIWQSRSTLDPLQSFSGFLFTIAHNLILNRIRKLRRQAAMQDRLMAHVDASANTTEDSVMLRDLEQMRQNVLTELPLKRKMIFQLIREEELTYQQVADKLNISIKTVEAQMTEALKHFRKKLHR